MPFDKPNTYQQPTWGGGAQSCASCHAAGGVSSGMSDRHDAHLSGSGEKPYAFDCVRCHATTVNAGQSIKDPALHINKEKDVAFSAGGSYDKTGRGCASTYCHSDGRPLADNSSPACVANATTGCHYADRNNDGVRENLGDQTTSTPQPVTWSEPATLTCTGCHKGRPGVDARNAQMDSNGHFRLANVHWIRQYPCHYCHAATVDAAGAITDFTLHANGDPDIAFDPKWAIGTSTPTYDKTTKVCDNLYCHSDGTTVNPQVREFPWNQQEHADCDTCHGHDQSDDCSPCHGSNVPQWAPEDQWKRAMPMYANNPGDDRANSHLRHLETEFSCENCHATTVVGTCGSCHDGGVPEGKMTEVGHVDAAVHVNGIKDVVFKDGGGYDRSNKSCQTACHPHPYRGEDPVWGQTVDDDALLCLTCHGSTEADVTDFDAFNGVRGRINMTEWFNSGHGRKTADGPYPSGNPPADFPGNPCWYCHDNEVLHRNTDNPLRLKVHPQFEKRFEKECVYCHMEGTNEECLGCHNSVESLSKQLTAITGSAYSVDHAPFADGSTSCLTALCHPDDASRHNSGAGTGWDKEDIKNQYVMTGVCLQCHDNDDNGRCHQCHTWNGLPENDPYRLGFDPGTGFKSGSSKASSTHFGYKHYEGYKASLAVTLDTGVVGEVSDGGKELKDSSKNWTPGQWRYRALELTSGANSGEIRPIENSDDNAVTLRRTFSAPVVAGTTYRVVGTEWKGGKFCWDCHDPHGDTNIYMIQDQVSTKTDGTFGIPLARAPVVLTKAQSGLDFAKNSAPYNGICNVCHQDADHYRKDYGDSHRSGRVCTSCHEHGFGEGHASGQACDSCHQNKPISTHTGFGQPRDCTKCHDGAILKRMDIMRQFSSPSHHVQGVEVNNRHCYACHWEATKEGLIDVDHHAGYNYKTRETVANAETDLALWGAGVRPTNFEPGVTAVSFNTVAIGTAAERSEIAKVSEHCLSCHSDQNNEIEPFGDCKTPAQYAWDRGSIASRYSQTGTTTWGKYGSVSGAAAKSVTKAFSAHGNAVANRGGWSATTGEDSTMPNTRNGNQNVQCFDCHSSHGSFTTGVTSSYKTFDNSFNGANLKETQAGKGGYSMTYRAGAKADGAGVLNPMNAGAVQCFDCHETRAADMGTPSDLLDDLPWGFLSTYGASEPVQGYRDTSRFGGGSKGNQLRFPYKAGRTGKGGHLKASSALVTTTEGEINGLCTPCHDPHGVSPVLGSSQQYAVPLLKGTWITSPYKEDSPQQVWTNGNESSPTWINSTPPAKQIYITPAVTHDDSEFAGLCLRCHPKDSLVSASPGWGTMQRNHRSVKGWGTNAKHAFSCSKCHNAHDSGLGRLMRTNCMNYSHRGSVPSGGFAGTEQSGYVSGYRFPNTKSVDNCHASTSSVSWPSNQKWNNVTPWQ